jgi:hypothetical protein
MDIEQMKLILEAVQGVGGDAKTVILAFLGIDLAKSLLNNVVVGFLIYLAYRVGFGALTTFTSFSQMAQMADISWPYFNSDKRKVLDIFQKGLDADKRKENAS